MFPQHTRHYTRWKGHGAARLSPAPRERGGVGAAAGRGERERPAGAAAGKGLVGDGKTRRWEMEGGDDGRGASQAGMTIDWSHTGRCYAWQG